MILNGASPNISVDLDANDAGAPFVMVSSPAIILGNGHLEFQGAQSTVTSCGNGPTLVGNDNAGMITAGVLGIGTCTLEFTQAWTNTPICLFTDDAGSTLAGQTARSATAITFFATGGNTYNYRCVGFQ